MSSQPHSLTKFRGARFPLKSALAPSARQRSLQRITQDAEDRMQNRQQQAALQSTTSSYPASTYRNPELFNHSGHHRGLRPGPMLSPASTANNTPDLVPDLLPISVTCLKFPPSRAMTPDNSVMHYAAGQQQFPRPISALSPASPYLGEFDSSDLMYYPPPQQIPHFPYSDSSYNGCFIPYTSVQTQQPSMQQPLFYSSYFEPNQDFMQPEIYQIQQLEANPETLPSFDCCTLNHSSFLVDPYFESLEPTTNVPKIPQQVLKHSISQSSSSDSGYHSPLSSRTKSAPPLEGDDRVEHRGVPEFSSDGNFDSTCTFDSGYGSGPQTPDIFRADANISPAMPSWILVPSNDNIQSSENFSKLVVSPNLKDTGSTPLQGAMHPPVTIDELQDSPQESIIMGPTAVSNKTSSFPTLGFNNNAPDPSQAIPIDVKSQSLDKDVTAKDLKSSPTRSDLSSSGWTEDGQDTETLRLISVAGNALVSAYVKLVAACASNDCKSGGTRESPKETTRRRVAQNTNPRKRRLNRSDDGSDDLEDDGDPKRQKQASQSTPASSDILPLACPFNKFDNMLFGPDSLDEAYHACATCSFINIAHLKQHLQRNHYTPRYHCFRCCQRFTSQAMAARHMRQQPPCETLDPPLYRERIGPDMIEDLGLDRKNLPGTDRVEYWHRLYNAFFPGAAEQRPVSPYYEGPAAQHIGRFLHFSRPAIRELLPVVQQRLGFDGILLADNLVRLMEEILQDATQRYLQQLPDLSGLQIGQSEKSFISTTTAIADGISSSMTSSECDLKTASNNSTTKVRRLSLTPPISTQESLRSSPSSSSSQLASTRSTPPTLSSSTICSFTTTIINSPNIPRTPNSVDLPARDLPNQDALPSKPLDDNAGEVRASFDTNSLDATVNVNYPADFDWAVALDGMEEFDWPALCPDAVKQAGTRLGVEGGQWDVE